MGRPVISDYELDLPTAEHLRRSLEAVLGPSDVDTCLRMALREIAASGLDIDELPSERLLELALALTRQRGLVAVIARSFAIRLSTYLELAHRQEPRP